MATTTKTKKRTMHLSRPGAGKTMCGRGAEVDQTDSVAKVTCKSCRSKYDNNKTWYASAKRKLKAGVKAAANA